MENIETRFVSIDGSTQKTALSLFIDGNYSTHILLDYSNDKNADTRFESMVKGVWRVLNEYKPNIIYIEETYMARNPKTTKILTRLQGVVYAWCINNDCEFNVILPSQWRKQLSISQSKKKREELKEQSIQYVLDKYQISVTDDEADAICIGDAVIKMFKADKEK